MINDMRRTLEDAIITYGVAKVLHDMSEPEMRAIAENALSQAWDRVQDALDEIERKQREDIEIIVTAGWVGSDV